MTFRLERIAGISLLKARDWMVETEVNKNISVLSPAESDQRVTHLVVINNDTQEAFRLSVLPRGDERDSISGILPGKATGPEHLTLLDKFMSKFFMHYEQWRR
jgi:hypothetical protein